MQPAFKNRAHLLQWQQKKMHRFFKRTLTKSNYYKSYFQNGTFELSQIPVIQKEGFMEYFDQINTVNIIKDEAMNLAIKAEESRDFKSEINGITVGLSTGTSGKRGLFLVSETERAQWVAIVMNRILKPKFFKKQKIAFFLRANSNLYTSVQSNLFEFQYFDIFRPVNELIEEMNRYQPDILAAQPSILKEIAKAHLQNNIHLTLTQIISFAEVLHDNDAEFIEQNLGKPIQQIYQCTEGLLGVSCSEGVMHLNEDVIHVEQEWIDDTKFYPIITDFNRASQPVIRYKMNDILQIKTTPCSCGSHFLAIEKILGRDDEVLVFEGINIYPDVISRKIALGTDNFFNYEIIQTTNQQIRIYLDCAAADFEISSMKIEHILRDILLSNGIKQNVELVTVLHSLKLNGQKQRKIRRLNYED